jgi:hypothetical protein
VSEKDRRNHSQAQIEAAMPPVRPRVAQEPASSSPSVSGPIVVAAFLYFLNGNTAGTFFQLHHGRYELGKASHCDIVVEEEAANAHHGALRFDGRNWRFTDSDSSNGTFLNGRRVGVETTNPIVLQDNDRIVIGSTEIVFKCICD